ncbi:MAG TPA: serine hydrolase, partial [Longimicrobium sp.]|nr:serine hydrolase [Longimicrobium sp.]
MICIAQLSLLLTLVLAAPARAQQGEPPPERVDPALTARLDSLVRGFRGDVGIYVRHLSTGATVAIDADTVFPTASLIKVPILLTLYEQVAQGRLSLDATVPYPDTLTYRYTEATDVVGYMAAGDTLPLREL